MKKRIIALVLLLCLLLCISGCGPYVGSAPFSIRFCDVGQGDCALIQCDGHYMLIDGGPTSAGDTVYQMLEKSRVRHLDILVASHTHADHIGGLAQALRYATDIDLALCNTNQGSTETFRKFNRALKRNGSSLTVPHVGDQYQLGSATVEVVDASNKNNNDSLVLLITYGQTRFLFTGDIEETAQTRISDRFENEADAPFPIDLIKMPHHGSYENTLYRFLRTFMPRYAVISVGKDNPYGHPHRETMELLSSKTWSPTVYRTDELGDILVISDGVNLSIDTPDRWQQIFGLAA